ncbi:hypothetical protein AB0G05_46810 [Nonomuraea wenchangensis]
MSFGIEHDQDALVRHLALAVDALGIAAREHIDTVPRTTIITYARRALGASPADKADMEPATPGQRREDAD